MNGAESLVRSLLLSGVDTCFANPGTSEMHFVAALDKVDGMRCLLGMAEAVVTGCADGYARMAGKPAATLMHCGPGLANGISNAHNARRANTPMVNIVGDHATFHRPFDSPLTYDTVNLARTVSDWVWTTESSERIGTDGAAAVQAAMTPPGQIATLILPSDIAWSGGGKVAKPLPVPKRSEVSPETIRIVAEVLHKRERTVIVMSGMAICEEGLVAAQRIAHVSGAMLKTSTQVPRMARGRGRVPVDRIPYGIEKAMGVFEGVSHVVLVSANPPTAFFGYPGQPSLLSPTGAKTYVLAKPEEDAVAALTSLADELGAPANVEIPQYEIKPQVQKGPFEPIAFAKTLAALLPENCVVSEDAVTSGRSLFEPTFNAKPHDWIQITGGAIGQGFPSATGAALACRDRKVVCLQADGAGMYTLQALWTQAREKLDIVNVVFANRMYKILHGELQAVGAKPGVVSSELFDLARPELDWISLANGMGVEASYVDSLESFADVFSVACGQSGPFLIQFNI